jgi:hypothetical protein
VEKLCDGGGESEAAAARSAGTPCPYLDSREEKPGGAPPITELGPPSSFGPPSPFGSSSPFGRRSRDPPSLLPTSLPTRVG